MTEDYIEISNGTLRARLLAHGARLGGLWHGTDTRSVVLGWAEGSDGTYMGALVGPVANRVTDAAIDIDGTRWQMQRNEGANCLHSGDDGLHARTWEVTEHSETAVTFSLTLQHGDCGLPGLRQISARYTLQDTSLRLDIDAATDRTTVMNIAHHPYWNLAGDGDIRDHELLVFADTYLPIMPDKLPIGTQAPVEELGLTARAPTLLRDAAPLDHNLCLAGARSDALRTAARLTGPNGMQLTIATTEPGLQVYDGSLLTAATGRTHLGAQTGPFAAMALEPQGWPDAPHHDGFLPIVLKPAEAYRQSTIYTLEPSQIP
ncbi:aldose epimerase family protein [Pseudosulfitobacter koreensis]|uniref:Galactose mutarotase n=1 Tax=Pseudosulfitobacter koreensis TaxID=2968472 RepID=A0ABT1Z0R7_9RHOB|nr:aldose epimerase family protein [Pseudosulfitobacter koreense]MCR8826718.1 galactose mutarotase [Pseudosulfitobacter koreense]